MSRQLYTVHNVDGIHLGGHKTILFHCVLKRGIWKIQWTLQWLLLEQMKHLKCFLWKFNCWRSQLCWTCSYLFRHRTVAISGWTRGVDVPQWNTCSICLLFSFSTSATVPRLQFFFYHFHCAELLMVHSDNSKEIK